MKPLIPSFICHHNLPYLRSYLKALYFAGFTPTTLDEVVNKLKLGLEFSQQEYLLTFDHADITMHSELMPLMHEYDIKPTLYFHTKPVQDRDHAALSWDEICTLVENGWSLGAHTYSHKVLEINENTDDYIALELEYSDNLIKKYTGILPEHFAYPGGIINNKYEEIIQHRYKSARLWTTSSFIAQNGRQTTWSDFYKDTLQSQFMPKIPLSALYINSSSNPFRLPSVEITALLQTPDNFQKYIQETNVFAVNSNVTEFRQIAGDFKAKENCISFKERDIIPPFIALNLDYEYKTASLIWFDPDFSIKDDLKIAIWGMGGGFLSLGNLLTSENINNLLCFLDNNSDKWNGCFLGKPIRSPDSILHVKPDLIIIAVLGIQSQMDIIRQIKELCGFEFSLKIDWDGKILCENLFI